MSHDVIWTQPPALSGASPLLAAERSGFDTPAILRFTSDAFMPEFMNVLDTDPSRLRDYRARRETWRGFLPDPVVDAPVGRSAVLERLGIVRKRLPGAAAAATALAPPPVETTAATPLLKLYQPAQQRHYLVVSSLVCRIPGLPDRGVDPGRGEQTACVVRRLLPPAGNPGAPVNAWEEHAWVAGQPGFSWQAVGVDARQLAPGEEMLPLFAVHFVEREPRKRRLFAGVIPVGRREAYLGAPRTSRTGSGAAAQPGVTPRTARKILFRKEVAEPWKALVRRAAEVRLSFTGPFVGDDRAPRTAERAARLKLEREHIQTVSWLVLLDLAKFLATYLKPVWNAVQQPARRDQLTTAEAAVFDALGSATLSEPFRETIRRDDEVAATGTVLYALSRVHGSLAAALSEYAASGGIDAALERQLDQVDEPYDRGSAAIRGRYPSFLFPLADPDLAELGPLPAVAGVTPATEDERGELALDEIATANDPLERIDKLAVLVLRALRDDLAQPPPEPAVPAAAIAPANAFEGTFVIRCVYHRPACEPVHGAVVSAPTEPFQMAGFFDPDAPARPVRIGLPVDTTPAGLRKFDKNTAFVVSDTLCGQIRRFKGMSLGDLVLSVLPWPLHKDLGGGSGGPCKTDLGLSLGMICSLSIPIITLCALILLMVMVSLLDFVFRWLPYFIICFPVPGLKAKSQSS